MDNEGQVDCNENGDLVANHHGQVLEEYSKKTLDIHSKWPRNWRITEDNVAAVVSHWTVIPVDKLVKPRKTGYCSWLILYSSVFWARYLRELT